jgi:hypothetical protein
MLLADKEVPADPKFAFYLWENEQKKNMKMSAILSHEQDLIYILNFSPHLFSIFKLKF